MVTALIPDYTNLDEFLQIRLYSKFEYNNKFFLLFFTSNSYNLIDSLFFNVINNFILFHFPLFFTRINKSLQKRILGHMNKKRYLNQLKDEKIDTRKFLW